MQRGERGDHCYADQRAESAPLPSLSLSLRVFNTLRVPDRLSFDAAKNGCFFCKFIGYARIKGPQFKVVRRLEVGPEAENIPDRFHSAWLVNPGVLVIHMCHVATTCSESEHINFQDWVILTQNELCLFCSGKTFKSNSLQNSINWETFLSYLLPTRKCAVGKQTYRHGQDCKIILINPSIAPWIWLLFPFLGNCSILKYKILCPRLQDWNFLELFNVKNRHQALGGVPCWWLVAWFGSSGF